MLSLSAIIYIMARVMPRINDEELKSEPDSFSENKVMVFLEKVDDRLKIILEKTLRRLRVLILKLDNSVAQKLHRFKKQSLKRNNFAPSSAFGGGGQDENLTEEKESSSKNNS